MARNPYVKVALFERVAIRLQDCKVVGQGDDYLLLERPAVKPRVAAKAAVKRNRNTVTKMVTGDTATATVA